MFIKLFTFLCTVTWCHAAHYLIISGELSGDRLGAWYVTNHIPATHRVSATGGPHLAATKADIIKSCTELSKGFAGIWQTVKHLWDLGTVKQELLSFIVRENVSEVVLVDCPLLNLPLARQIKKQNPAIRVVYLAPPELWLWGRWGIDWWLSSYCDEIIVLYPFEQAWYTRNGLTTNWYGWPLYNLFTLYQKPTPKKHTIAFLPGSRRNEIKQMAPLFCQAMCNLATTHPELSFLWVVPACYEMEISALLQNSGLLASRYRLETDPRKTLAALAPCCAAATKPGTITLELALLHVPSVIAFRTSWLTHACAAFFFKAPYIGLPNLCAHEIIFPELIQNNCTVDAITNNLLTLYKDICSQSAAHQKRCQQFQALHAYLSNRPHTSA